MYKDVKFILNICKSDNIIAYNIVNMLKCLPQGTAETLNA